MNEIKKNPSLCWIYGPEWFQQKEHEQKIRKDFFSSRSVTSLWNEAHYSLTETPFETILETLQAGVLGNVPRLISIRDASHLKELAPLEYLSQLLKTFNGQTLCLFFSSELDQRKKISQWVLKNATTFYCPDIPPFQRKEWVQRLAQRHSLKLPSEWLSLLSQLDPWSLGQVESELQKISLHGLEHLTLQDFSHLFSCRSEVWVQSFLSRNRALSLLTVEALGVDFPTESLRSLGLLNWHLRQWMQEAFSQDPKKRVGFDAERDAWKKIWTFDEILALQVALKEIDQALKTSSSGFLVLWTDLVLRFCLRSS